MTGRWYVLHEGLLEEVLQRAADGEPLAQLVLELEVTACDPCEPRVRTIELATQR